MNKTLCNRFLPLILVATATILPGHVMAQHGWPVEPGNADHPMGNSSGEFYSSLQHVGIDLMELPMYDSTGAVDASAPWIIVTVAGTPSVLSDSAAAATRYNHTHINPTSATDPAEYVYYHIEGGSFDADYVNAFNNGTAVAAGDEIGMIVRWSTCNFHHLHYELDDGVNYLNPLADITPNPDDAAPHLEGIHFAQDNSNPWVSFGPVGGEACTVVSGPVDILAEGGDRDEAGAALGGAGHLWVYNVRWRACPDTNPDCAWQETRPFDNIPHGWYASGNAATRAQFSTRAPYESNSSFCDAGWDYNIVTNYIAGAVDAAGNWNTTAITDGSYSVSVEMEDFAGNKTTRNRRACVQNTSACTTELSMRDANDDYGAIPYEGPRWWVSPDITANAGTADEDRNINVGAANPIELRVWNNGSCDLPAGTSYDVCLGWGPPSGSVAHPLPAAQQIDCETDTVPAGGWAVGTSRTTTITWTPDPDLVPLGHHCLVAWVDMATDDPVRNTPSVREDDNRVQQNITFQTAPEPGSGAPAYSSFWINPQRMIDKRSIELRIRHSGNESTLSDVRLHVAPGLVVDRIIGGGILGGYLGDKPRDPCKLDPKEHHELACGPWKDGERAGMTRVIGGIDPNGRLLLEGISVLSEPVRLTLEVTADDNARKGQYVDIEVLEYGVLSNEESVKPVGGLTIRFEH